MNKVPDFNALKRKSNCILINDKQEEKLSGGFYDHNYISSGFKKKYDSYFAIIYLLEGSGFFTDYTGTKHQMKPGSLFIRHAGTTSTYNNIYNQEGHWLEFAAALPASFYNSLLTTQIITRDLTYLDVGIDKHLLRLAEDYINALSWADMDFEHGYAFSIFLDFLSTAQKIVFMRQHHADLESVSFLNNAKRLLSADFDAPLDMHKTAVHFGMSYESFRKKFQKQAGIPPNVFRIRQRLNQADALLFHTQLSIKEIAQRLGYAHTSIFTRQYFKFRHRQPSTARNNTLK